MPEPLTPPDTCSYQRQDVRTRRSFRRHQLLAITWLSCSAFTWPGRVPHLSYNAAHGTASERAEALRLLEEYPSQATTDACLAGLEDSASEVRAQAARCVGASADDRAITNLLDLASAKDPQERIAALEALGRFAPARALSSIEQALADPQPGVRLAAAGALTGYVRAGSFDASKLAPLLRSELAPLRLAAVALVEALQNSGPRVALASEAARDKAPEVRAAALRALGRSRLVIALPPLVSGLSDGDETARLSAIAALGDSNLPAAVNPLRAIIAKDTRAAHTALAALGRIDDPSALTAIAPALAHSEISNTAVSALIARARRLRDGETLRLSAEALQRAIEATHSTRGESKPANSVAGEARAGARTGAVTATDSERKSQVIEALARGVVALAPYCDVQAATVSLTRALEAGPGDNAALAQQLAEPRGPQPGAAANNASPAQQVAGPRGPQPGAAANNTSLAQPPAELRGSQPEAAAGSASPAQPPVELRGPQPVAAVNNASLAQKLAALRGSQPGAAANHPEPPDQLLRRLDDSDARVRERSSLELARSADNTALSALAERLERKAPHPELSLQACAGAMLRATALPTALRERLLQQFQAYLTQPDETVATSALYALRASRDPRAARWIAALLRGSSAPLRAAAVQALGDFEQVEARRMLRDMLRGDNVQNASNAAIALAEIGSDRDVEALLRAAERGCWPVPPSAAYAAARITQRGATRKHSLERVLCRFTQLRDTYVLANSVAALAALGAEACDAQISPSALLDPALPSALRVAAATWLHNTRPRTPEESAQHSAALASCAADHDVAVATACMPHAQAATTPGLTLLRLSDSDGQTALPNRVVALRLPDATVFIGQTDAAGQLLLPRAETGALQLEDPADPGSVALP